MGLGKNFNLLRSIKEDFLKEASFLSHFSLSSLGVCVVVIGAGMPGGGGIWDNSGRKVASVWCGGAGQVRSKHRQASRPPSQKMSQQPVGHLG